MCSLLPGSMCTSSLRLRAKGVHCSSWSLRSTAMAVPLGTASIRASRPNRTTAEGTRPGSRGCPSHGCDRSPTENPTTPARHKQGRHACRRRWMSGLREAVQVLTWDESARPVRRVSSSGSQDSLLSYPANMESSQDRGQAATARTAGGLWGAPTL